MKEIKPKIYTFSGFGEYGDVVVKRTLKQVSILSDVNMKLLEFVIHRWSSRNYKTVPMDENMLAPLLIFPLEIGKQYSGDVPLCCIKGDASAQRLTVGEKLAIKLAFKFSPQKKRPEKELTSADGLQIIADRVLDDIKDERTSYFQESFIRLVDAHALLLKLGELKTEQQSVNYSELESSLFKKVSDEWLEAYRPIFELSIKHIETERQYFRTCCYMLSSLLSRVLQNSSATGLEAIIQYQNLLWFRLNSWWQESCSKVDVTPNNENSYKLEGYQARIYGELVKSYIEGWENAYSYNLAPLIRREGSWKDYGSIFKAFRQHLEKTVVNLAHAVLTGNEVSAEKWTDILMRWNTSRHADTEDWWANDEHVKIIVTPDLLSKEWEEVQERINDVRNVTYKEFQPRSVFSVILKNAWKDANLILSDFLLSWSLNATNSSVQETLSAKTLKKLLHGSMEDQNEDDDEGYSNHAEIFVNKFSDYLVTYIRRAQNPRWERDTYGGWLSRLADRIEELTEPERISGRMYSSSGSSIEKIVVYDFLLGAYLIHKESTLPTLEKFQSVITQETYSDRLVSQINQDIQTLESIDWDHYKFTLWEALEKNTSHDFDKKSVDEVGGSSVGEDGKVAPTVEYDFSQLKGGMQFETQEAESAYDAQSIQVTISEDWILEAQEKFKAVLQSLSSTVQEVRATTIRNAFVSDEKLVEIAERASRSILNEDANKFPVNLFAELKLVTDELQDKRHLVLHGFPKASLIKPEIGNTVFPLSYHSDAVSSRLYPWLMRYLFDKAESSNVIRKIHRKSERGYLNVILAKAEELKNSGLQPILIVGSAEKPSWLWNWKSSRWKADIKLPAKLEIQHSEAATDRNYLFTINDIPVYTGYSAINGSLLLASDALREIKFRQMSNGYPISVSFKENENDPWSGVLQYSWEVEVDIDLSKPVYLITYPESKVNEI